MGLNMDKAKDVLFDGIEKFTSNRHINAIKNGMIAYVPFTIIASVALLIANFPSKAYINFVTKMLGLSDPSIWQDKLNYFMNGTMDLASIICLLFISYNLAKEYKETDPMYSSIISLCVYFLLTPLKVVKGTVMLEFGKLGATSLIVAIVIALIVPEIYRLLMKKKLQIKLPSSVPPAVAGSFASLIPMAIIFFGFWAVKLILLATPFDNIHVVINTVIGKPLSGLGTSVVGYTICVFLTNLLWVFGIHGSSIIMFGAIAPVLLMASDANRQAVQAGVDLPNILTYEFFSYTGGVGLYICIAALIVSKSKQMKEISKVGIVPAIFGIHEPLVFGYPIMFNPFLGFVYIVAPFIGVILTYIVTSLGWVAKLTGTGVPWTTPPGIYGFLATGGHISGLVWQLILGVIYILFSIPFVKMYDRQKCKEEGDMENSSAA
ncbi:PTS sugar transporter subunit IIC [Neobacillus dielmonensis]|uniref:PTS sugar transporter subunit IIC n=1 Tax=Neobacillus dielmonensis TaxID=1347369 RepID=UPI000693C7A6|nr:PTS transporter subunit EIIC [Neobacillus dielmonensis]